MHSSPQIARSSPLCVTDVMTETSCLRLCWTLERIWDNSPCTHALTPSPLSHSNHFHGMHCSFGTTLLPSSFLLSLFSHDRFSDILSRRSISLNSFEECVTLYEMGLSNRSEEVNAIWCADNLGVVKIVNPSDPDENRPDCCLRSGCHDTSFQTVTLDEILPTSLAVYLAKIDVEGHESQVIQGAMELFRDACRRPVFAFIEFHGTDSQESDDFLGVLFDLGYLVFANHNFRMDYPLFSVTPSNRREFLRLLERGRREEKWEVDLFISLPTVPRLIA